MKVQILIADGRAIVRQGILLLIKELNLPATIIQVQDYPQLIEALQLAPKIDLLLCDINVPGGDNFKISVTAKTYHPEIKTLIFSAHNEDLYALRYIQAGANGFLHKDSGEEEIKHAIVSVLKTGKYISNNLSESLFKQVFNSKARVAENPFAKLSNREIEVATLLVKGIGLLEISNQMRVTVSTISTYKTRLYEKLKINNIVDLVMLYNNYLEQ